MLCADAEPPRDVDVDRRRHLISQQVDELQSLIESSKFEIETRGLSTAVVQRSTEDAQTMSLLLLALARARDVERDSAAAWTTVKITFVLDIAKTLEQLATCVRSCQDASLVEIEEMRSQLVASTKRCVWSSPE